MVINNLLVQNQVCQPNKHLFIPKITLKCVGVHCKYWAVYLWPLAQPEHVYSIYAVVDLRGGGGGGGGGANAPSPFGG